MRRTVDGSVGISDVDQNYHQGCQENQVVWMEEVEL